MNIIDTSANAKVTSSYGRFIPRAWACVSKENQKNLMIICSRNQIECSSLGGGYFMNLDTETFMKLSLSLL